MKITLPIPPSVNALYANAKRPRAGKKPGRGRFKTGDYAAWLVQADAHFMMQKRGLGPKLTGQLVVEIRLPATLRGDCSNRIKAAEDFLVSRNLTGDDKHNWKVSVERDPTLNDDLCTIEVKAM